MVFFYLSVRLACLCMGNQQFNKKDVPQRIKNKIIVLLLVTSWIGVLGYFFHFEKQD